VEIETAGDLTAGESVGWKHGMLSYSAPLRATTPEGPGSRQPLTINTRVATGVDSAKFFRLLISRLT
jgi:hypothetical protein